MSEMDKKRREAIRYLGFGRNAADERTYELIEASFDDLNRETSPRFVYRIFDLDHSVDGLLRVGTMAVVLQACAAAELEEYCDEQQKKISTELEKSGLYLRPRFSPGYGDFPIEFQEPIMRMLDCAKKIGLTMTDSYMMSPTKSVTAIIGISTEKERCPISGCEACGKKDCAYRR